MNFPNIIDIEASGFGVGSYPIEIGYADPRGLTWCALVKPAQGWQHWDESAEKLHQISQLNLAQTGQDVAVIAQHLNDVFLNQTLYCDGWINDFTWLNCLFDAADMSPHFKLEDIRLILSPYQKEIWHVTKLQVFDGLQTQRHRASIDAKVLQLTWLKTSELEAQGLTATA